MGVASLVLGIVSIIIAFIPCLGMYAIVPAVIGLILGLIGTCKKKEGKANGLAIAGLILSILASCVAGYQIMVLNKAVEAVDEINKAVEQASAEWEKASAEIDKALKNSATEMQ